MMYRSVLILLVVILGLASDTLVTVGGRPCRADDEMKKHLENLRRQVEDPRIDLRGASSWHSRSRATRPYGPGGGHRRGTSIALDRSGSCPRPLQSAESRAPDGLANSIFRPPFIPGRRSWLQQEELDPTDRAAREEAMKDLDAVLIRFRAIQDKPVVGDQELLDQNIRFRLAQALADRAELDAPGSEPKKRREEEAVKLLERRITEPTLRGFALLLRPSSWASWAVSTPLWRRLRPRRKSSHHHRRAIFLPLASRS